MDPRTGELYDEERLADLEAPIRDRLVTIIGTDESIEEVAAKVRRASELEAQGFNLDRNREQARADLAAIHEEYRRRDRRRPR